VISSGRLGSVGLIFRLTACRVAAAIASCIPHEHVQEDEHNGNIMDHDAEQSDSPEPQITARTRPPKAVVGALLALLLLVNLAASLYQLPLNRVIERRLCREYYAEHDPSLVGHDGDVSEDLCKVDDVQKGLAWVQGAMDTAWIVGGEPLSLPMASTKLRQQLTGGRFRHDHTAWFHGREIWATYNPLAQPRAEILHAVLGCHRWIL
jgi:hypothetical protein